MLDQNVPVLFWFWARFQVMSCNNLWAIGVDFVRVDKRGGGKEGDGEDSTFSGWVGGCGSRGVLKEILLAILRRGLKADKCTFVMLEWGGVLMMGASGFVLSGFGFGF